MSQRFLRGVAALIGALSLAVIPLSASAAPTLNWTDISGQLTVRTNRPVWAMAYASPYWFYTDGQDLWNGGQVYRYDGQTQANITVDVRNAGISRVDSIVSDGQGVLFLQGVAAHNNQFIAIEYLNGSYVNVGYALRNAMSSNEGIMQIVGRNGTWFISTSAARVLKWFGNTSAPSVVSLPQTLQSYLNTLRADGDLQYCPRNIEGSGCPLVIVPVSGGQWLFAMQRNNYHRYPAVSYIPLTVFRYDGSTFSDISDSVRTTIGGEDPFSFTLSSNGSDALLSAGYGPASYPPSAFISGSSISKINTNLLGMAGLWTGSQWLLISGSKELYSLTTDGVLTHIGEMRDYFVTGASNGNGTTLLGGAVSVLGNTQPTNPLTAKLAKVTEGAATTNNNTTNFGGGQTAYSTNGPTLTTTGNPSDFRVGQGGTFIYRATASDPNGVDRIDLFVNGVIIKTCYADTCEFSTQYYTNGQTIRSIPMTARAWDRLGNMTQLPMNDNLTVDANSTASANTTSNSTTNTTNQTSNGIASWTWFDPNQSFIRRDQNLSFNVGAWDADGLSRIEIVVNGSTVKTCDLGNAKGNQACAVTLWGGNYPLGTIASMNAKITDAKGNAAWTPLQNINVVDASNAGTTSNVTTNATTYAWDWLTPNVTTITKSGSFTYFASAQSSDGLARTELWVNGSVRRSCDWQNSTANQTCSVTLYGSDFPVGTEVAFNARVIDRNGRETWTTLHRVNVQPDGTTTNTNTNTTVTDIPTSHWSWSSPETATIATNQSVVFTVGAWDGDGMRSADFYVNGYVWQTCSFGDVKSNVECAVVLNGSNWNVGGGVYVNAKLTDAKGNVTWTAFRQYAIVAAGSNTTSNTTSQTTTNSTNNRVGNLPGWVTETTNRDGGFRTGDTITFTANAGDGNGVNRIEMYVDGVLIKTCTAATTCTYTSAPYSGRSVTYYGATMVDNAGYSYWTGYKSINRI